MSRASAAVRALVGLAASTLLVLAPAHAATAADELGTEWGGDTVNLAWDGSTYSTTTASFLGVPVAVPGDRAYRRLVVTNDGPTAGILRAWVVDVELEGARGAGSRFFDELSLDWSGAGPSSSASLRSLASVDRTRIARVELAAGESTELTVGYELAASATSGNAAHDGALSASFDVLLRIEGVTGDGDVPPDDGDDPGDGDDDGKDDDLAQTGATVARTLLAALLLCGGGILLLVVRRRRERASE